MSRRSSEMLAREMAMGPLCDRCLTELEVHAQTLVGQKCDLDLAMADLWRSISIAVLGEDLYWESQRLLGRGRR